MREACGDAHLKAILATGDLKTLRNVYRASMVAMQAGADFIKTSTGKEDVNATLPVSLVMVRAIRDYLELTGAKVGFKPAGGMKTAKDALAWLILMKEELGTRVAGAGALPHRRELDARRHRAADRAFRHRPLFVGDAPCDGVRTRGDRLRPCGRHVPRRHAPDLIRACAFRDARERRDRSRNGSLGIKPGNDDSGSGSVRAVASTDEDSNDSRHRNPPHHGIRRRRRRRTTRSLAWLEKHAGRFAAFHRRKLRRAGRGRVLSASSIRRAATASPNAPRARRRTSTRPSPRREKPSSPGRRSPATRAPATSMPSPAS